LRTGWDGGDLRHCRLKAIEANGFVEQLYGVPGKVAAVSTFVRSDPSGTNDHFNFGGG
jgi:hypothetical protein